MLLGARERSSMSLYHGDRAKRNQLERFSFNRPGRHRGWPAESQHAGDGWQNQDFKDLLSLPQDILYGFFLVRSCKDVDIRTHGLSAAQTDVFCFCMILPLSLGTTLLRRHRKTNQYTWNSVKSSSCGTKVQLLSDQSISSLIVSQSDRIKQAAVVVS